MKYIQSTVDRTVKGFGSGVGLMRRETGRVFTRENLISSTQTERRTFIIVVTANFAIKGMYNVAHFERMLVI